MKKKLIGVILAVSFIANIILGFTLYAKAKDKSDFENGFLNEITFAIQRLEK